MTEFWNAHSELITNIIGYALAAGVGALLLMLEWRRRNEKSDKD